MTPLIDPENPQGWLPGEEVLVYSRSLCWRIARKYDKQLVSIREDRDLTGHPVYICIFKAKEEDNNDE
ncbi:MAG: hypothetical protein AAGA60_20445 [Cyanobacteria bacterium P01_E01_bin.42]